MNARATTLIVCAVVAPLLAGGTTYVSITEKYAVSGWEIVGVWQLNYGIDVQHVVEHSEGEGYRERYVTSKEPKARKNTSKLSKVGNKYTVVGSRYGDYFVIEGSQLKTYDNDGYIETLKPVTNR